ncbi:hypothetical protein [Pseudocnuella soli]|uniref:hypothetical protein n=1 Tax=Pseudocnuella soli TaxID=2502779 RepID=UPI001046C17A|nr:hypothetical protein [Pseudocnuella soli]
MSFRNMVAVQPVKDPAAPKAKPKRQPRYYVNTLEYELITSLVMQQYTHNGEVRFDQLLAMPQEDRIPTLMQDFGVKRMHHMILMMVKAFCYNLRLPKIKKLTDTKMSGVACDFMVAAQEDNLALEDIILFFERAKGGKYGPIKSMAYHYQMMQLFEQYRKERRAAQQPQSVTAPEPALKAVKADGRVAPEPTPIGDLLHGALVIDMNKKMSG